MAGQVFIWLLDGVGVCFVPFASTEARLGSWNAALQTTGVQQKWIKFFKASAGLC